MDIGKCKTCDHFGTMYVTGDTRKYPRCRKNKNKATWDVTGNECEYKERDGIKIRWGIGYGKY